MRKISCTAVAFVVSTVMAFGQNAKSFYHTSYKSRNSGSFGRGTGLFSFSYGFPNLPISGYSYIDGNHIGFGPLYAKYEHSILGEVGIGAQTAFSFGRYKYGNDQHENIRAVHVGLLGYYHFNKLIPVRQLDVYAGAGLAFRRRSITYSDNTHFDDNEDAVYLAAKIGIRYYPKSNIAIYAEAGYDHMSDVNFGISFRVK